MEKVLLLRSVAENASSREDKYQKVFEIGGIQAVSISPISFAFCGLEEFQESLKNPRQFSGVIFSSPRTVQAVEQCIEKFIGLTEWTSSFQPQWVKLLAFSVGTSTASAATDLGFTTCGEDSGNAENLVKVIKEKIAPNTAPLLFPCGSLKRDVIPTQLSDAAINFTTHTVYETCPNPDLKKDLQRYLSDEGLPHAITFFSPSGVRFSSPVLKEVGLYSSDVKFFAIGPTTAAAMDEHKYVTSGVAMKPSPECLLKLIKDCT